MHYFKKPFSRPWAILWRMLFVGLLGLWMPAQAEIASQAHFRSVMLTAQASQKANLALELDLLLSDELKEALNKGMTLFFTFDVELERPRQWWFNERVFTGSRTVGIRYNMLLREWRVLQNGREYREFSLDDALQRITRVNNWVLHFERPLVDGTDYVGKIRLRLDTSLLERPFQITALNNSSAWSFSSSWKNFNFHFSVVAPGL